VQFSPRARENLKRLRKGDQQTILDAVVVHLSHQPEKPTRKRKRLEENPLAPWELRVGKFRVFYDVQHDEGLVVVVAVGHKIRNTLWIGGEEIAL
jgi:mRNA-degrading endonuclease RelE of RelBE toxin-antitoxin system